ncbi:MAG: FtsX-like permease family protein [Candidatus Latescibacteria bacterium]|nr:FtsX-like permease family protein [Candidatus Latescibacterota bacterium]
MDALAESIREMPSRYVGDQEEGSGYRQFLYLQPLSDIHLRSHYMDEIEPNGDINHVYIFSAVAIFILIIATINFMNLATARSAQRAREVGLRKVVGAQKGQLVLQFLGESVVLAFLSLGLSLVLLYLSLPMFNGLAAKSFSMMDLANPVWILGIVAFAFGTGVFSGSYPAFVISAFQPIQVLKGQVIQGSGAWLRKGLVVFQFVISIALIIGSFTVFDQLSFMKNRDLGFEKEQLLVIKANNHEGMRAGYQTLKQQLGLLPDIQQTSMASTLPGKGTFRNEYVISRTTQAGDDGQTMLCPAVDHDIVTSLGLEIIAGRGFSKSYSTDAEGAYLINETALHALGWNNPEDAIGQELTRQFNEDRTIVGVIKDFHFRSLQHAMEPMVLRIDPSEFNYAILRIDTRDIVKTVASIETVWNTFSPDRPLEAFFLNDDYNKQYRSEERVGSLLTVFTGLAIFVACLGLFGLTSFTTQQRLKEIGVRKVLGASVASLVFMLARNVTGPVLLAMAVAMPLAYLGMRRWLEAFAYRTEPSIETFLLAGVLSLAIAWLTVGYQSVRSALANPVSALRDN